MTLRIVGPHASRKNERRPRFAGQTKLASKHRCRALCGKKCDDEAGRLEDVGIDRKNLRAGEVDRMYLRSTKAAFNLQRRCPKT